VLRGCLFRTHGLHDNMVKTRSALLHYCNLHSINRIPQNHAFSTDNPLTLGLNFINSDPLNPLAVSISSYLHWISCYKQNKLSTVYFCCRFCIFGWFSHRSKHRISEFNWTNSIEHFSYMAHDVWPIGSSVIENMIYSKISISSIRQDLATLWSCHLVGLKIHPF
jgi:hypothetical protein